jgi:quinolinate synthase
VSLIPVLTDYERSHLTERQPLPERYVGLSDEELDRRIAAARAALGRRLVILGHHYQRDEVIKFADYIGDSYKLSQRVSQHPDAEFIVFCGVHFMAESADVLSAPQQQVILPDLAAGCSMADMADPEQLQMCWRELEEMGIITPVARDARASVIPVTYINSSAAIKAFVGERGGVVCTSSNAGATLTWAWERGEKILFLPDQHLGRNTAYKMGVPLDEMVVWDPNETWGGLTPEAVRRARIILWKGHCSVHVRFTVRQIEQLREQHPGLRVIVHPEVPWEVVQAADDAGSTEYIIRQVKESPAGSIWAVGTEVHLVNRLATEVGPERTVLSLDQFGCLCSTMFRVSPNHLLWILEGLLAGEVHNRIAVPDAQKHWNKVALERMLAIR